MIAAQERFHSILWLRACDFAVDVLTAQPFKRSLHESRNQRSSEEWLVPIHSKDMKAVLLSDVSLFGGLISICEGLISIL